MVYRIKDNFCQKYLLAVGCNETYFSFNFIQTDGCEIDKYAALI